MTTTGQDRFYGNFFLFHRHCQTLFQCGSNTFTSYCAWLENALDSVTNEREQEENLLYFYLLMVRLSSLLA